MNIYIILMSSAVLGNTVATADSRWARPYEDSKNYKYEDDRRYSDRRYEEQRRRLSDEEVLEKHQDRINFIKYTILERMIEKIRSYGLQTESNQGNYRGRGDDSPEKSYVESLVGYKNFLRELSQKPAVDSHLFKEFFMDRGERIQREEVDVLLSALSYFIDDVAKNMRELRQIPYPTAKYLYEQMSDENKKDLDAGKNVVLDKNSLKVLQRISNYLEEEQDDQRRKSANNQKSSEKTSLKIEPSEIDVVEENVLLAVVRSLITASIGVKDRAVRLQNDLNFLEFLTDPKGAFTQFSFFSMLDGAKRSLQPRSDEQWQRICLEYLGYMMDQYVPGVSSSKPTFSLKDLKDYQGYDWLKTRENTKLLRPESLKDPFVKKTKAEEEARASQSSEKREANALKEEIKNTYKKKKDETLENMRKEGTKKVEGLITGLLGKIQGGADKGLGGLADGILGGLGGAK